MTKDRLSALVAVGIYIFLNDQITVAGLDFSLKWFKSTSVRVQIICLSIATIVTGTGCVFFVVVTFFG